MRHHSSVAGLQPVPPFSHSTETSPSGLSHPSAFRFAVTSASVAVTRESSEEARDAVPPEIVPGPASTEDTYTVSEAADAEGKASGRADIKTRAHATTDSAFMFGILPPEARGRTSTLRSSLRPVSANIIRHRARPRAFGVLRPFRLPGGGGGRGAAPPPPPPRTTRPRGRCGPRPPGPARPRPGT